MFSFPLPPPLLHTFHTLKVPLIDIVAFLLDRFMETKMMTASFSVR